MTTTHRALAAAALALGLSACAYPEYVNDEYRYVPLTSFAHGNNSYRIFDKPSASKLVITPSLATAVSDNVIRNVTFGRYDNALPPGALEAAVAAYLKRNGRKCQITSSSLIYDPQWEFTYNCEIKYTAYP
jgi:hypothetical protein